MNGARGFYPYTTGVMWKGWELHYLGAYHEMPWEAYHELTGEIRSAGTLRGIHTVIRHINKSIYN